MQLRRIRNDLAYLSRARQLVLVEFHTGLSLLTVFIWIGEAFSDVVLSSMMPQKVYANAPITEALIDLRINARQGLSLDDLKAVQEHFKEDYPNVQDQFENQLSFQLGPVPQAHSTSRQNGYRWEGKDPANIVQARLDAFAFSRLTPYDRWETFAKEAQRIWQTFSAMTQPERVTRIAVRFINRFDFPGPTVNLKDYLTIYPEFPESQFKSVQGTLLQLRIAQPDINGVLIINEALIPSVVPGTVAFVLDFDLFSEGTWDIRGDAIWKYLDQLRARKDQIFESSITDKTRELIS